jgi:hypothetical protein
LVMTSVFSRWGGQLVVAALGLGALGCNQIIGIEEAHVDAELNGQGDTGGQSEGQGGTEVSSSSASHGASEDGHGSSSGGSAGTAMAASTNTGGASSGTGGSNTGANSEDASAEASTTSSEPPGSLCEAYCDEIMEACVGQLLQYRDLAQCLAICETLPEGTLGKVNENTLACRMKFAGDARYGSGKELEAYCRQAGPAGGGRCGSDCEGFCSIMMGVCTVESSRFYHFQSEEDCLTACRELPSLDSGYSATDPSIADGNHVQCRLFHVMSAAMLDPEEHCEHAMGVTLCEEADPE